MHILERWILSACLSQCCVTSSPHLQFPDNEKLYLLHSNRFCTNKIIQLYNTVCILFTNNVLKPNALIFSYISVALCFISDIAIFVVKRDVKLQPTNLQHSASIWPYTMALNVLLDREALYIV